MPTKDELNWLIGFIEGEGNFIIILTHHKTYNFNVAFQIAQKELKPLAFCQKIIGGKICKRGRDKCYVLMLSK